MNAYKLDEVRPGSSQALIFDERLRCFPMIVPVAVYRRVKHKTLEIYDIT